SSARVPASRTGRPRNGFPFAAGVAPCPGVPAVASCATSAAPIQRQESRMNYAEFLKAATAPKVVSREIEHDGQTVTFYFRAITADEADDLSIALYGDDGKIDRALFRGNVSRQVAKSLCDEQGKPIAT